MPLPSAVGIAELSANSSSFWRAAAIRRNGATPLCAASQQARTP